MSLKDLAAEKVAEQVDVDELRLRKSQQIVECTEKALEVPGVDARKARQARIYEGIKWYPKLCLYLSQPMGLLIPSYLQRIKDKLDEQDVDALSPQDLQSLALQISEQVDNLLWLLSISIDRGYDGFVKVWASEVELSRGNKASTMRYVFNQVTAKLFVGIGQGQIVPQWTYTASLLKTWFVPFCDDFELMMMTIKGTGWSSGDAAEIGDALSNTILTLPVQWQWQQGILLSWVEKMASAPCEKRYPHLKHLLKTWWRRVFLNIEPPPTKDPRDYAYFMDKYGCLGKIYAGERRSSC